MVFVIEFAAPYKCDSCGKLFYSAEEAERAYRKGCPMCGSDNVCGV